MEMETATDVAMFSKPEQKKVLTRIEHVLPYSLCHALSTTRCPISKKETVAYVIKFKNMSCTLYN
jgi:hypothetical protein